MQFAAGEHRFEQIAGVHCPLGLSRSNDGMQLVDEQDDPPLRAGDVFEHGLEALFELSTILCTRDQRAHIERNDPLILEAFGDVAADDALRQSLDNGRLADAGVTDEHRVVFGAARKHLNDATNFFVAPDYRIEFAALRFERQIAPVPLERFVRAFGVLGRHALVAAHVAQRLKQFIFC